jgi:2'-5' RNA ligase
MLELADADLNDRFAESQNGMLDFFIEFRFTDPRVCRAIADLQEELRKVDASIAIDQSCAPDTVHFTMTEIRLRSVEDVHRVVEILEEAIASPAQSMTASMLDLQGVGMFDGRVLYAKPIDNDAVASLRDVFGRMQRALAASNFKPRERAEFVAHATLCKARTGKFSEPFCRALREKGFENVKFGSQPLLEIHFCCKRRKEELKPPVVWRLRLGERGVVEDQSSSMRLAASENAAERAAKRW